MSNGKEYFLSLLRRFRTSFIYDVVGTAIAFLLHLFLARYLKDVEYGKFVYVWAWVNVLLVFAQFGWPNLLVKQTAVYLAEKQTDALHQLILTASRWTLKVSLVLSALFCLSAYIWHKEEIYLYLLGALSLPPLVLMTIQQFILQGAKKVAWSKLPSAILRPLFLLFFLLILYKITGESRSTQCAALNLGACVLALGVSYVWGIRKLDLPPLKNLDQMSDRKANWRKTLWPLFILAGMQIILSRTDLVLVGLMRDTREAGIYSVAIRVATLINFVSAALSSVLAPAIAELFSQNRKAELQSLLTLSSRISFIAALSLFAVMFFAGSELLGLFGDAFLAGYRPLIVLGFGFVAHCFWSSAGYLPIMTNFERDASRIVTLSAGINFLLNLVFIYFWGITGAALATSISLVLRQYLFSHIGFSRTGMLTGAFSLRGGK